MALEPRLLTEEERVVDVSFQLAGIILRQSKRPGSNEEEFFGPEVIARIPAIEGLSVTLLMTLTGPRGI